MLPDGKIHRLQVLHVSFREAPLTATFLAARDYARVWPRLRVISCWDAAFARADAARLRALFPSVEIEGKGLLATEGIVTFPWFGRHMAAVTSHVLGFEAVGDDGEPVPGTARGLAESAAKVPPLGN